MIKEIFEGYSLGECLGEYNSFSFNKLTDEDKKICGSCRVYDECLEYSLKNERFGVWAAHTEEQRQEIRKSRGMPTPPIYGYRDPVGPVNVYINRERSAKRMRDMKWRKAQQKEKV